MCFSKLGKGGLCPLSFGIATGFACGLFMAVFAWMAWFWGIGLVLIEQYGVIYYGYAPTFVGGLFGALWGLIEGFLFGFILALVYDFILCRCKSCKSDGSCGPNSECK